jgi:hypothetical protein
VTKVAQAMGLIPSLKKKKMELIFSQLLYKEMLSKIYGIEPQPKNSYSI